METASTPGTTILRDVNSGFYSTSELCDRYHRSRMTINRWMKSEANPFPQPRIASGGGGQNLWAKDEVHDWENSLKAKAS